MLCARGQRDLIRCIMLINAICKGMSSMLIHYGAPITL